MWPIDLDILFLIPIPWIGPVIAPMSIAVLLVPGGFTIAYLNHHGRTFTVPKASWLLAFLGAAIILTSFMKDFGATFRQQMPEPYSYWMLLGGEVLFIISFLLAYQTARNKSF